jgi:hypothetical protein
MDIESLQYILDEVFGILIIVLVLQILVVHVLCQRVRELDFLPIIAVE